MTQYKIIFRDRTNLFLGEYIKFSNYIIEDSISLIKFVETNKKISRTFFNKWSTKNTKQIKPKKYKELILDIKESNIIKLNFYIFIKIYQQRQRLNSITILTFFLEKKIIQTS